MELSGYYMHTYYMNNKLIYFFNEDGVTNPRIISYNIGTDESKEIEIDYIDPSEYKFAVVEDKYIVLNDGDHVLYFLDEDLNTLYSFKVPIDAPYPEFAASKDYSRIYYFKGSKLYECDTKTAESKELASSSKLRDAYPISVTSDEKYLEIYAYSSNTGYYEIRYFDFEAGELLEAVEDDDYDPSDWTQEASEKGYYVSSDGKECIMREDRNIIYYSGEDLKNYILPSVNDTDIPIRFKKSEMELKGDFIFKDIDWEHGYMFSWENFYSDETVTLEFNCYDFRKGEIHSNFIYSLEAPFSLCYSISPVYDDGYMIVSGSEFDTPFCYAWKYAEDDYVAPETLYKRLNYIPEYLDVKRKELEEKYKTFIYLGSEVFSTDQGYTLTCSHSSHEMYKNLCMLDEVFSIYPQDLFEQIKYGGIKTIGVYLCSGFTKRDSYGIEDAVALAGTDRYERFLALDIDYWGDLRRNIIHELSHWIDNRINQVADLTGEFDFEEEWSKLNPEDFYYMNDYNKYSPFDKYTYMSAGEDAYFIDTYSLTKATEDRARMFEYLMRYDEGVEYNYFESAHLREKMHLYFDYIRKSFDTTNWPEETVWEHKLKLLDRMYSGDTEITYSDIYPEIENGDKEYSLGKGEYEYLMGYCNMVQNYG